MKNKLLNIKGKLLSLEKPVVMGILNVTPDSFYAGSRMQHEEAVTRRIETIISEGGAIIDIGGYSTRPDADDVTLEEEWNRLEPALTILAKKYLEIPVSVDTFRAEIGRRAVTGYGVSIINDISGGSMDENMFATVAALNVPYVLTHFCKTSHPLPPSDPIHQQGFNETFHPLPPSDPLHPQGFNETPQPLPPSDPIHPQGFTETSLKGPQTAETGLFQKEVMMYFSDKLQTLRRLGVNDVILDPGFGFGKSLEQNYELIRCLQNFSLFFESPLLVGISRKSVIYNLLNCSAEESLNGTTILNAYSLLNGANILRVHDVKAAVEVVKLIDKIKN